MMRSLLFKNLGLKILSLCFAVVLWYSVVSERQSNLLVTVPLTFVNVPKAMKVVKISDERVSLHLEGPISALRGMEIGKIRGTIDLNGAHEGRSRYELLPRHFNLPEGIRVEGISPEMVYVVLEKLLTFRLPVKVRLKGKVDRHYIIENISVDPSYVWVTGDRRARSSIDNIPTDVIDVEGLKKTLVKEVGLDLPRDVRLKKEIGRVRVQIALREKVWDREVKGVRVILPKSVEGLYTLSPPTVTVLVRGPATGVESLSPSDIEANVPITGLRPGDHFVTPKVRIPQGMAVLSIQPKVIKVTLLKKVGK